MNAQTRTGPLNVLYIRDHLVPSGGTTYVQTTLPRFDPRRIRTSLCVLQPRDRAAGALNGLDIATFFAGRSKRDPRFFLDVLGVVRACRPDLLVLSGPKSMVVGGLLARLNGLPTCPRFNHMIVDSSLEVWLQRRLASTTGLAMAVSHAVRRWAAAHYRLPEKRIRVVQPGHDVAPFMSPPAGAREAVRASLDIGQGALVITVVGRLVNAQKGQDHLIRAMPGILQHRSDVVLVVVGDGPDRAALDALVHELHLNRAVRLVGHRDDIPAVLAATDVVVLPSVWEDALPLVALEGLAAGRPVVAVAVGGLPEIVRDGDTGILVPKGDVPGLVDAILRLFQDRELAGRLGRAGRQFASGFTVEAHVHEVTELYEEIMVTAAQ